MSMRASDGDPGVSFVRDSRAHIDLGTMV